MRIKSVNIDISSGQIESNVQDITKFSPPVNTTKQGRKYEGKVRHLHAPYLEEVLFNNEICEVPLTDPQIRYNYLRKYDSIPLKRRFQRYKETIGSIRTRYNNNSLYATQAPVHLVSFCYNEEGRIVFNQVKYYQYLSFRECYERCLSLRIADPRFITHESIFAIRSRINSGDLEWTDWRVPTDDQIAELESEIGVTIYDSIQFLPYLNRKATME